MSWMRGTPITIVHQEEELTDFEFLDDCFAGVNATGRIVMLYSCDGSNWGSECDLL